MIFVEASVYLAILRDTYEAFCFLQFFKLCAFFVGGEEELATQLAGEPAFKLPFPLQRYTVQPGPKFLRIMKLCILQYVVVRPLNSLAAIICQAIGVYGEGEWRFDFAYIYLQVLVGNISFTVSFYCLFTFYLATKEILRASKVNREKNAWWRWIFLFILFSSTQPLLKFISIKLVVFWVFWQGLIFAILAGFGVIPPMWRYSTWEFALVLNNSIITIEMFSVAVLHIWAYPYDVYKVSVQSQRPLVAAAGGNEI